MSTTQTRLPSTALTLPEYILTTVEEGLAFNNVPIPRQIERQALRANRYGAAEISVGTVPSNDPYLVVDSTTGGIKINPDLLA